MKPFKIIGKTKGLGQVGAGPSTWSKKTGPGTPWYRPGPFKNLGKTNGSYRGAAGNQRACWGPPGKSYGRLETFKILGKTKGWGRTVNVVRKKIGYGWSGYRTCNVETWAKQH